MLIQFKVYIIAILYFFGALFMLLFPPRNYKQSGAKMRITHSGTELKYTRYADERVVEAAAERIARSDPEVASVVRLRARTARNRSLVALELHSDRQSKKPGILIIAALNGMAWGAPNAVLELAEKLLYDTQFQTPFFNDYDWYLIPLGNPDGVQFTQNMSNLPEFNASQWAKNATARASTRPTEWHKNVDRDKETDDCFGTNVNRNFAFHWQDDVHKAPDRCSQWFPGHKPFSTSEAQAIRKYVDNLGETIKLAIHLHASFVPKKELMLYPWRYSLRRPSNHLELQAIGEYAARQSRLPDGRIYEVIAYLNPNDGHDLSKFWFHTEAEQWTAEYYYCVNANAEKVHQSSNDGRVAGSVTDYLAGVVGTELVYLLKPYHQKFPNVSDSDHLREYVDKAMLATLSLVRGWRRSTKQNTLSFFGRDVEF